ncbi:uncharacterized protein LOC121738093 [Aricia agestis]|uniref:uncharacterized protein LOC121738093 n=1 Tax=Aricia agestis TaxID=91739 RepID=UPI001C203782|nr:uncharacterized protein LOC121738093 [Aricia agestis]
MAMTRTPNHLNKTYGAHDSSESELSTSQLLASTLTKVKRSIYLLNQTRNMKGELKSGMGEELLSVVDLLKEIIARDGKEIETQKGKVRTRDSGTQCDQVKDRVGVECKCMEELKEEISEFREEYKSELLEIRNYLVDAACLNVDSIHVKIEDENAKVIDRVSDHIDKQIGTLTDAAGEGGVAVRNEPESMTRPTYASVTRGGGKSQLPSREPKYRTLHSLVVSDKENFMPTIEIVETVGRVVEAKREGIKVDRIRRGKGRKVIIGFRDKKDRERVRDKIEKAGVNLDTQIIENKDPQVVLYGVLKSYTDDDILEAIREQNKHLVEDILGGTEDRMSVKYKKKGKDDHTQHVVLNVSPGLWARFTEAGHLYIDIQRVRVADQSPLIQCSRCLGYGHGRRFCSAAEEKCAHCSGAHRQSECDNLKDGKKPCCTNCKKEDQKVTDHHAFSTECPVRQRWDAIARAAVAYDPEDK